MDRDFNALNCPPGLTWLINVFCGIVNHQKFLKHRKTAAAAVDLSTAYDPLPDPAFLVKTAMSSLRDAALNKYLPRPLVTCRV